VPNTAGTGKWMEGDPFTSVQSDGYWSSTSIADDPDYAWVVFLFGGGVYFGGPKTNTYYVWPVRGGQ
jgi:hypothetical protein